MLHRSHIPVLIAVILVSTLVFLPGVSGPFVLDDQANLIENPHIYIKSLNIDELEFAASTAQTGYRYERGLSFISFALNYYGSGGALVPTHIKLTNIVIHAFNATLVLALLNRLIQKIQGSRQNKAVVSAPLLAGFLTTLWACHPIQVSTVLYAVQRMTLLSGTTTLIGCLAYVIYRTAETRSNYRLTLMYCIVAGCILTGFHFKENAILLPVYLVAIELVLRNWLPAKKVENLTLIGVTVLPGLLGMTYLGLTLGDIQASYAFRDFTLGERLLTQPVVLFWYLKLLLIPNLSDYSLFLDNFPISRSLVDPWTTVFALAAGFALVAMGLFKRFQPTLLAATIWFLGGHLLESSFLPLELAFEHRNYIPALSPLIFIGFLIYSGFKRLSIRPLVVSAATLLLLTVVAGLTAVRAHYWGDQVRFIVNGIENRPTSIRAQSAAGLYYATRDPEKAYEHYRAAASYHPYDFASLNNQYAILSTIHGLYDELATPGVDANLHNFRSKWTKSSLRQELDTLEHEILDALTTRAVSAQSVEMLERAVHCRVNDLHACADSETLMTWLDTAIANPRQRANFRAYLQFSKCRLLSYQGYNQDALALMNQLVQDHPEIDFFIVKLAELYELMGEEKKAKTLYQQAPSRARERYR